MIRAYEGGCHCGRVRFRVTTEQRAIFECNCSIWTKKGYLHLIVDAGEFELLQGQEALTTYQFHTKTARHLFCCTCGICSFYVPRSRPTGYSVNARCIDPECLDGPLREHFELRTFDGRNHPGVVPPTD